MVSEASHEFAQTQKKSLNIIYINIVVILPLNMDGTIPLTMNELRTLLQNACANGEHNTTLYQEMHYILFNYEVIE